MSRVENTKGQLIYWFDGKTPKKTRMDENGLPVTERFPAMPWRRFMKPSGDIVQLSLTPAAADRNAKGAHALVRIQKKVGKGFVPADECPVANGHYPSGMRTDKTRACEAFTSPSGASVANAKAEPCKHLLEMQEVRRREHSAIAKQWAERFKSSDSRLLELMLAKEEREQAKEASEGSRAKK